MSVKKSVLAVLALVLALTLVVGPLGAAAAQSVPNCTQYHTVVRGDTLALIAARYNTTWRYLAEINNLSNPNLIYTGSRLCVAVSATLTPTPTTPPGTPRPTATPAPVPTFSIASVTADQTVTIRTANFPAGLTFDVLWGDIGTRGIGGIKAGTVSSGTGGSFLTTLNIPSQMAGKRIIAVRLESTTTRHFSYNWFYNRTAAAVTPVPTGPAPTAAPVPTFSITGVTKDTSVTIRTANFPANTTFNVLMGPMGTRGIGGVNVGTLNSGAGGTLTATYTIPASLTGSNRIAIRLESTTSGHFSYNWFYNSTAP
jgi:hypothetical protein